MTRKWVAVLPLSLFCWSISSISIGVKAQIIPDNTLGNESSVVTPLDSLTEQIDGGASRGSNLFHSFREFNIKEGNTANFANPIGIQTIFSRVTGNNPSRLFGMLGVLGNANLFLINPNGIIFGPNAKLNISGSFIGSTANSIIFPDGSRFSATNPGAAPLLTINVPIPLGLEFEGGEPGSIINAATLESEQNLALIGGTVVSTGSITAPKGISLLTVGEGVITTVQFDNEGTYLGQVTQPLIEPFQTALLNSKLVQLVLQDGDATGLTVTSEGQVSVVGTDTVVETGDIVTVGEDIVSETGDIVTVGGVKAQDFFGGGSIVIDSYKDIQLSGIINASSLNVSEVLAVPEYLGNGGDITLLAKGDIQLKSGSFIASDGLVGGNITLKSEADISVINGSIASLSFTTLPDSKGGDLNIMARSLFLNGGAQVGTITQGDGKGGNLSITVSELVQLEGFSLLSAQTTGQGNAGNLTIVTEQLIIRDGAEISTVTFGKGKGGGLTVMAFESVELVGSSSDIFSSDFNTNLSTQTRETRVETEGDAGNLTLETKRLIVRDGAQISTSSDSKGKGGNLTVTASKLIELVGFAATEEEPAASGLFAQATSEGDASNLTVETERLVVRDGAQISAATSPSSKGNGGNLTITAFESIEVSGTDPDSDASGLFVKTNGEGDAGILTLITERLLVRDGAQISAGTFFGKGKGGILSVTASESVELVGIASDGDPSGLFTANQEGEGDAGNLMLETRQLIVRDGAVISANTFGKGKGGNLLIIASESIELVGIASTRMFPSGLFTRTNGEGDAGNLMLETGRLVVRDGAQINAATSPLSQGNGGNLTIIASESAELVGFAITTDRRRIFPSGLFTQTDGEGNAGNLTLETGRLLVQDRARISSGASGTGIGGDIFIMADNLTLTRGTISAQTASNTGGNITLYLQNLLTLRNGSQISTTAGTAQAGGDGGNITIDSPFIVTNPQGNSDITANAFLGSGGNIDITTQGIFGLEVRDTLTPFSDITASSAFGLDGDINIDNLGIDPTRGIETLPQEVVNPQVFQGCQARDGQAISEFYRLGRGGLPSSPDDWLNEVPFSNEGLIPLEIPLNNIPPQINWKDIPADGVFLSCQPSVSQK